MRKSIIIAIAVGFGANLWPHIAHANYIDPTTGGILLQVIFGGVAGIAVLFKVFWHRLASFPSQFKRVSHRSGPPLDNAEDIDPTSSISDDT